MSSYLAFDLGASSGRAIIGRLENGRLSLQEVHRFSNGPVKREDAIYWDFPHLVEELKNGLKKALAVEPGIAGIGIDTWGVDYVLFDRDTHRMIRLPYHYRDPRSVRAMEKVREKLSAKELFSYTGIQCMSINTSYQLCAHRDEHPEELKNSTFLMMPDALGFALGGELVSEYTDCSTTDLLDPEKREWCRELIDRIGLPQEIFPKIVPPCTVGGTLSRELQKECGCGPIPIFKVGSHDTASAVAAVPAPEQGNWAYISAGTWALLGAEIPAPRVNAETAEKSFTNEGGLNRTIRYLTNIMGSWLFQETKRVWNESGRQIGFGEMSDLARQAAPCRFLVNPNDATFVTPGDMPGRIRAFCQRTGQGEIPDDAALLRTIYDSLALYFASKLHTLEKLLGVRYECLNVVGGGTKDHLLMQLTADALNIPVVAGPVEATAVGNLLAQAITAGEVSDLAAARKVVKNSVELLTYTPNAEMHRRYQSETDRFAALTR